MDFAKLIDELQRGDASAGPILVSVVAPRLLGYAGQIGSDLSEVERELAVERAIESAIDRIHRYDPEKGTFPAWARTFVFNEIRELRRASPHAQATALGSNDVAAVDRDEDLDDTEEADPKSAALASLVLGESESSQLLLRLRFAERLDHPQIAKRLGTTVVASRKRLERVLRRLRERAASDPDLKHLLGDIDE